MNRKIIPEIDRFWAKVNKTETCWLWIGGMAHKYGVFNSKTETRAHRYSYELYFGPISQGLCVCHKCDNPICVNPHHLFLGTNQDNVNDKMNKGRHPTGEKVKTSKLNNEMVKYIRNSDKTSNLLSKELNISSALIINVKNRKRWRHVL